VISSHRTKLDPAFLQFRAQLAMQTTIDPDAYEAWICANLTQLRARFLVSGRQRSEAAVYLREEYVRCRYMGGSL